MNLVGPDLTKFNFWPFGLKMALKINSHFRLEIDGLCRPYGPESRGVWQLPGFRSSVTTLRNLERITQGFGVFLGFSWSSARQAAPAPF